MSVGFGILSWRGHASLSSALETYHEAGLFDLFDKSLLFLPEMDETGIDIARRFDLPHAGTPNNLGILGGFKALAQTLQTEILVLAENDYMLIESREEAKRQLAVAQRHIEAGSAHVWRLRHRWKPGQTWETHKAEKYWPKPDSPAPVQRAARWRRLARPNKARRLIGWNVFLDEAADRRFPDLIRRTGEGDLLVSSRSLPWANNIFMVRRDFFLNTVIPAAEARIDRRLVNGFPTIEIELNHRGWWRRQDFWIGVGKGLFTHERQGDRGY